MFAQRARAAALRLGVAAVGLTRADALAHVWEAGDVVLLQATLRPEQQLDLVQQLRRRQPTPRVVAVTGHLETGLRQRLKAAFKEREGIELTFVPIVIKGVVDSLRANPILNGRDYTLPQQSVNEFL